MMLAAPVIWQRFATRLRWVSITPFGVPDVPLEYGSATRSRAGSMSTCGTSVPCVSSVAKSVAPAASPNVIISRTCVPCAASAHFSTSWGTVKIITARESASCFAISPAVDTGLIVELTAPSVATAWNATEKSGTFGLMIATTSRCRTPRACSPAAARSTASYSPAYV